MDTELYCSHFSRLEKCYQRHERLGQSLQLNHSLHLKRFPAPSAILRFLDRASWSLSCQGHSGESKPTAELLTVQPPEGPTASARKQGHTLSKYSLHNLGCPQGLSAASPSCFQPETGLPGNPRAPCSLILLRRQFIPISQLLTRGLCHQGAPQSHTSVGLRPPRHISVSSMSREYLGPK